MMTRKLQRGKPKLKRGDKLDKLFQTDGAKSVNYTVTFEYAAREEPQIRKSMATNWIKALDLALRAQVSDPQFNIEIVPRRILVERK